MSSAQRTMNGASDEDECAVSPEEKVYCDFASITPRGRRMEMNTLADSHLKFAELYFCN